MSNVATAIGIVAVWAFLVGPVVIYLLGVPPDAQQGVYELSCVVVGILAVRMLKGGAR